MPEAAKGDDAVRPPRAGRSSSRGVNAFDSPRVSSNRTTISFSIREGCWNAGPACLARAWSRCPGKARKPGAYRGCAMSASRWKSTTAIISRFKSGREETGSRAAEGCECAYATDYL
eukprot:1956376-Pyramimonas_sp.AAC.1